MGLLAGLQGESNNGVGLEVPRPSASFHVDSGCTQMWEGRKGPGLD